MILSSNDAKKGYNRSMWSVVNCIVCDIGDAMSVLIGFRDGRAG